MTNRPLVSALLSLMLLSACVEEPPTATNVAALAGQGAVPAIQGIETANQGDGLVLLKVTASDPNKQTLNFKWSVDNGQLAGTAGAAVQWRLPKEAGTYTATVEVKNTAGAVAIGTQKFTVDATGKAAVIGNLQLEARPLTSASSAPGRITIPGAINATSNPTIVPGNPTAPAGATPTPAPAFLQPVATPAPGTVAPAPPPQTPIATPTPTPNPSPLPPSPLPTAAPPTPEPGVPIPPPLRWIAYPPEKIPNKQNLRSVHFLNQNKGWIAGSGGTILHYNKVDPAVEPALIFRNGLVPAGAVINRIFFTSETKGFICGGSALFMRTLDGGQTWQDIKMPALTGELMAMVVYNEQIVVVADAVGKVYRTQSANAELPAQVVWETMPTKPTDRPGDTSKVLLAGAGFQTDTSLSFFVGDAIYQLDADNVDPTQVWKRLLQLEGQNPTGTDIGDGRATSIKMVSQTEIWVGTSTGNLLRSFNGGQTWTRLPATGFFNRENNGNTAFLPRTSDVLAMSVIDSNNAFLAHRTVYDTRDGAKTWRSMPGPFFTDIQIDAVIVDGQRDFRGIGIGAGGTIYQYRPGF